MEKVGLLLVVVCLSVSVTCSAFDFDNAWYTYVDRVESARNKRAANQFVSTASPLEATTPHNSTELSEEVDNHIYYEVQYWNRDMGFWKDMDSFTERTTVSLRLSQSTRQAVRVQLKFRFPFYGYNTSFLYVASGGFLYAGTYPHSYLASAQYIAPLMAGFNPSIDRDSVVSYYGDESLFVAEWKNLRLDGDSSGANFTFQALIFKNGTLVFSYKDLPMNIEDIPSPRNHPVKVGVSDAYYHDTWIIPGYITRRTVYVYHETMLNFAKVDGASSVMLTPMETCTSRRTCSDCTMYPPVNFKCVWCTALQKCSDGFDRHRQDWTKRGCDEKNVTVCSPNQPTFKPATDEPSTVGLSNPSSPGVPSNPVSSAPSKPKHSCPEDCGNGHCVGYTCICDEGYSGRSCQLYNGGKGPTQAQTKSHAGVIVFILLLLISIVVIAGWVGYAYRNPNTPSGLYLIKITRCYSCKKNSGSSHSYKYQKTAANI